MEELWALLKPHGKWWIGCGLCILPYSLVERMFWYMCLVHVLVMLVYVDMSMNVNTSMSYVIKLK